MENVSRAEQKIAEAAKAFRFDFRGLRVLDIGSSTGGFTDFALKNGAEKVIAVEKGTRQMRAPLRFDPRVELHEKTDFFALAAPLEVDVVVADVSFVSLRSILLHARGIVSSDADFLVMLKPQFEASDDQLNRGVVKNERLRREIIKDFERWLAQNNFVTIAKRDNEITGKVGGNRERFYWLREGKA